MNQQEPTIIIFGLCSAGLFLLRELSKKNYNVYGIARKCDVGRFSKYGQKYIAENEFELKEVIDKILGKCKKKPKGIIASAYYLSMIANDCQEIFELIDIDAHNNGLLNIFDNKIKSYNFLKGFNIPTLKTYLISEANMFFECEFPLILKWNSIEFDQNKRVIQKTKVINNKAQLDLLIKNVDIKDNKLILQRYVYGEDITEYGYGGYFVKGKEVAGIFINPIRQFPQGIYSFARETKDNSLTDNVKTKLLSMLQNIEYTGFIHFDILVDKKRQEYYVLDINPRPWNSVKILGAKYSNLIDILFNNEKPIKNNQTVQWVDLFTDFISIIKRCLKYKSLSIIYKDYRQYFERKSIFNIFEFNDLKPSFGLIKCSFIKLVKKLKREKLSSKEQVTLEKGIFTLSLDTELCWGQVDKPKSLKKNKVYFEKSREVIDEILKLMEKYDIPATWAVVGHLFLDRCDFNSTKHIDIPRSNYSHYKNDWFYECPCTNLNDAPLWYGSDIVKKIIDCKVHQEIASHSFSHIPFGDENTKSDTVKGELNKCIQEAERYGLRIYSFVFPRNSIGYLDEVKNAGFNTFRGVEPSWYKSFPSKFKKVCHIIDQLFAITPSVSSPKKIEGLIEIPASMFYIPMNGFRKHIPINCRIIKAKRGIRRAINQKKVFHLWFSH